jgi:hypothetical protein
MTVTPDDVLEFRKPSEVSIVSLRSCLFLFVGLVGDNVRVRERDGDGAV